MNDDFPEQLPPSRSAKKRAAKAIEELAAALVGMAEADYRRLPLAGALAEELQQARAIKAHGARKRQLKHLAGMLREDDRNREQIETFMAELEQGQRQNTEGFHRLEELRQGLCDPVRSTETLAEIERTLPGIDTAKIHRLAKSVQNSADKRAFREIFRMLRDANETQKK
ncbi:MAG: ribosome biogenesis factor YjgA [Syntrophotaleaceae bacterium]